MSLNESAHVTDVNIKLLETSPNLTQPDTTSIKAGSSPLQNILKWKGVFYAVLSALIFALCNIFIRKCVYLTWSEIAFTRFTLQLVTLMPLALKKKYNICGLKKQRIMLSLRGIVGTGSMMSLYLSVTLINPSDTVALFNCFVIFVTIFARIFLKEKLTIMHLFALAITMKCVFLISQPEFLFKKQTASTHRNESYNASLSTIVESKPTLAHFEYLKLVGVCSALFGSLAYTAVCLITKKLAKIKAHVSVISIYMSYVGMPASLLISAAFMFTGMNKRVAFAFENIELRSILLSDLTFALISSSLGIIGNILTNLAMQNEDASKVSILESTDLIFNFILQYLFLNIKSNLLSTIGAFFIFVGALLVMLYKIVDKRHTKKLNALLVNKALTPKSCLNKKMSKTKRSGSILKNLFFYKF